LKRLPALAFLLLILSVSAFANEGGEHHEPPILYKWINFGILMAGIGFVAVKTGGPFLAGRARDISVALDAASRVKAEAEAQVAEITRRISNLDGELASMKADARREMEKERQRAAQETEQLLAKTRANAEQEIQSAAKNAEYELRRFSSQLAMQLAEQKIRARMNGQVQAGLVSSFVAGIRQQPQTEPRG
jgi:F-type H+-transporting ATPase subunit b